MVVRNYPAYLTTENRPTVLPALLQVRQMDRYQQWGRAVVDGMLVAAG